MARFIEVAGTHLNVDKIKSYYHTFNCGKPILCVKTDDGNVHYETDRGCLMEESLRGNDFIVQVIPCVKPLYARYEEAESICEYPVDYLGLCADGTVRPLGVFGNGVQFCDKTGNFIGLSENSNLGETNDRI